MSFLDTLQQKVGFTRKEAIAILTLSATFLTGLGIRWFQSTQKQQVQTQQQFDYSKQDSAYASHSRSVEQNFATPRSLLPSTSPAEKAAPKAALKPNSININTATKSQLMDLPGIGASFADRIIQYRQAHGKFNSVAALSDVKGIGEKKLEKLRPFVRVK